MFANTIDNRATTNSNFYKKKFPIHLESLSLN